MQNQIRDLLKDALKNKDEIRLTVYRSLLTAFMNELVATGKTPQDTLSEKDCQAVVRRSIKQRIDAKTQYENAGRHDLAEKEVLEEKVLIEFLPPQISEEELKNKVSEILSNLKPLDQKMLGKYIGICNKELSEFSSGENIKKQAEKYIQENI